MVWKSESTAAVKLKRLLWIVNPKSLMEAEVPILRSLGWRVFIPKVLRADSGFRSGRVRPNTCQPWHRPEADLSVLERHQFYGQNKWSDDVAEIINRHFEVAIIHFSGFPPKQPWRPPTKFSRARLPARRLAVRRRSPTAGARSSFRPARPDGAHPCSRRSSGVRPMLRPDRQWENESQMPRAKTILIPLAGTIFKQANTWKESDG